MYNCMYIYKIIIIMILIMRHPVYSCIYTKNPIIYSCMCIYSNKYNTN